MSSVMNVANSLPLWILATLAASIIFFQAFKFKRLASQASASVGMTKKEVQAAFRTGVISSIGPSFAIVIIAISLLSIIGNPVTLMRIAIVGSAPIEMVGASIGAEAVGAELGTSSFNEVAFTTALWVMTLGGTGWLLFTALFTKSFGKIQTKAASSPKNMYRFKVLSTAAMIGAFGYLGSGQMVKGFSEASVLVIAAVTMPIIMFVANKYKIGWLKEWSLGLVVLLGISVGFFIG